MIGNVTHASIARVHTSVAARRGQPSMSIRQRGGSILQVRAERRLNCLRLFIAISGCDSVACAKHANRLTVGERIDSYALLRQSAASIVYNEHALVADSPVAELHQP